MWVDCKRTLIPFTLCFFFPFMFLLHLSITDHFPSGIFFCFLPSNLCLLFLFSVFPPFFFLSDMLTVTSCLFCSFFLNCNVPQCLLPLHCIPVLPFLLFCVSTFSPSSSFHLAADPVRGRPFCGGWEQVDAMWPRGATSPYRVGPQPGVTDGFLLLFSSAIKHRCTWWNKPAAIQGGETAAMRSGYFLLDH